MSINRGCEILEYTMSIRAITKYFNRTLALSCTLVAISQLNYGFDNQAFATTQSMTAFTKQFGEYNPQTGLYAIPAYYLSLLNSLNYIGFALGASRACILK